MAKVLSGSEKYTDLLEPRAIGKSTAPNSVKYAACSRSIHNEPNEVGVAVPRCHTRGVLMRVSI